MKWIDTLEAKFGRYAIPGIVRVIVAFNALVFLLYLMDPRFLQLLYLDPNLVMHGQVWRLVTFIFIPSIGNSWLMPGYLYIVFWLLFIWMLGDGLEGFWGSFRLNLYIFTGMIAAVIVAFLFHSEAGSFLIKMSLVFAFATIDPDYEIIMVVFPLKIKWLARIYLALLLYYFLVGTLATKMDIVATLANYVIFFGPQIWKSAGHRMEVTQRRKRFEKESASGDTALHRCTVCDRTDITNPDLEFRVSADGNDYCAEHLPGKDSESRKQD